MSAKQCPLKQMLAAAQSGAYAIGAFNCRYPQMIRAVLEAAQEERSPVALEIAQLELEWFGIELPVFMENVAKAVRDARIDIPYAVHLDHTWDMKIIDQAIACGFTSVMIDASSHPLQENIAITRDVAKSAHAHGVGVEAELGKIGGADAMESPNDTAMYTDPAEAALFVRETDCDSLAVSVGSAHGVYAVKNPTIDYGRLAEIRAEVSIPLVLHGGTGLPVETVRKAIAIPGGGISKLNVATELELTLLDALGVKERMSPEQIQAVTREEEEIARVALKAVVAEKMRTYLNSAGRA